MLVDSMPGPSSSLTDVEKVNQLSEMFPAIDRSKLRAVLLIHGSVARTALSLTNSVMDAMDGDGDRDSDLGKPVFLLKDPNSQLRMTYSMMQWPIKRILSSIQGRDYGLFTRMINNQLQTLVELLDSSSRSFFI